MLKSLKDILKFIQVLAPVSVTGTVASTGVDTQDFGSVTFLVAVGAAAAGLDSASNKFDIVMQDSDVNTDGSYANCVDADIFNAEVGASGIVKALDATSDASSVWTAHYRGNKRFVRIRLVETGTASAPIGILAVAGHSELNPPL